MSNTQAVSDSTAQAPTGGTVDMKLEVLVLPPGGQDGRIPDPEAFR